MSLCITHFTSASPLHGQGLYTPNLSCDPSGLGRFDPAVDRRVSLRSLNGDQHLSLLHDGYINAQQPDWVVVCGDSARFWHYLHPGDAANAVPSDRLVYHESLIVASRSIPAGEELLIHPSSDVDYFRKMALGSAHRAHRCSVTKPDDLDALGQSPYGDIA